MICQSVIHLSCVAHCQNLVKEIHRSCSLWIVSISGSKYRLYVLFKLFYGQIPSLLSYLGQIMFEKPCSVIAVKLAVMFMNNYIDNLLWDKNNMDGMPFWDTVIRPHFCEEKLSQVPGTTLPLRQLY